MDVIQLPKERFKLQTTGFIIVDQDNYRVSAVFGDPDTAEYFTGRPPYSLRASDKIAQLI